MSYLISTEQMSLFPIPYNKVEKTTIRNGLRFYSTHCARIPYPIRQGYFSTYFLLFWSGSYLLKQIKEGTIYKDGVQYQVIYHKQLTRGKILANSDSQFALSFRQAKEEYDLPPVVVISQANPGSKL